MSGSPKPSATAGTPSIDVEMPAGMFFEAADYNEANTPRVNLEMTRHKVSRHRSALKARVTLLLEDLGRISSSLHAADRQGNAAPHWDSALVLKGKLDAAIAHLADQIDKAERRYEESVNTVPDDAPASATAGGIAVVVDSGASALNYPGTMQEAIYMRARALQAQKEAQR